ncbi:MHYT domain-containing protein [Streptomyces sp. NPDC006365]|uniref:MHYT domain-containing protein n=1 Tax=Streptomyces sp. NPDC006365 TaxID=3364744 RepID=UPI0036A544BC
MQGTVDGFSYGAVTPVAAYLMACLGGALGLRCIVRTLSNNKQSSKPGWLALGAVSIGCGIWTMHFIAMIGFQVEETRLSYDVGLTVLSLLVAIAVVGIGVFIVGYGGSGRMLAVAGIVTGLGVAAMHYLGMAAIQMAGSIRYALGTVALSIVIAVVAATAALWAAVSIRGFMTSLGASLVMGVAVSGMHYTGMAAVSVHLHDTTGGAQGGDSPLSLLLPMLMGPVIFLVLAGAIVMFDPLLVTGDGDEGRPASRRSRATAGSDAEPSTPRTGSLFEGFEGSEEPPSGGRPRGQYEASKSAYEW